MAIAYVIFKGYNKNKNAFIVMKSWQDNEEKTKINLKHHWKLDV